jgi:UDP-N-acetyl-D-mannosaminuronate dehydrogenase
MFLPQIDGLLQITDKISREAESGALVSIESTIPKGTSKKIFEILNHRLHVVHVPHRWYALEEKEHGVNQPRVIGGVCDCCLKAGMQFYSVAAATTPTSCEERCRYICTSDPTQYYILQSMMSSQIRIQWGFHHNWVEQ